MKKIFANLILSIFKLEKDNITYEEALVKYESIKKVKEVTCELMDGSLHTFKVGDYDFILDDVIQIEK